MFFCVYIFPPLVLDSCAAKQHRLYVFMVADRFIPLVERESVNQTVEFGDDLLSDFMMLILT